MNDEISSLGSLLALPVVKAEAVSPSPVPRQATTNAQHQNSGNTPTPSSTARDVLKSAEVKLLRAVLAMPGEASSTLPKRTAMSPRRCLSLRESLAERGLLRVHHVKRAERGRTAIVLEVTEQGLAALQRVGGAS